MKKTLSQLTAEAKKTKKKTKSPVHYPPGVIVNVAPVHGSHATKGNRKKLSDKLVTEETGPLTHGNWSKFAEVNANPHLGTDTEDVHENLGNHYTLDKLDPEHIKELSDYSDGSEDLNQYHIDKATASYGPNWNIPVHDYSTKVLDDALARHETPEDMIVYHGAGFDPDQFASQHPHRVIKLPPYISTSVNKSMAGKFSRPLVDVTGNEVKHILEIHVPKGHPGFYLGNHSSHNNEREFLLPRNLDLKIHPEPRIYTRTYGPNVHVWTASIHNNAKDEE